MPVDAVPVTVSEENVPDDLHPVLGEAIKSSPIKLLFYLLIVYLFLSSDVFIKRILSKISGSTTMYNSTTTKGTIITGVLLVIIVAIIDLLIRQGVL